MKIGQYCQRQRCRHDELEQFWQAFASRGFVSDSWAFLYLYVWKLWFYLLRHMVAQQDIGLLNVSHKSGIILHLESVVICSENVCISICYQSVSVALMCRLRWWCQWCWGWHCNICSSFSQQLHQMSRATNCTVRLLAHTATRTG